MLKVGVTGGIGSGKSVVCEVFNALGIPVLKADEVARDLMNHDKALVALIQNLMGEGVYKNGLLDSEAVSAIVFNDKQKLLQLNALVHPATVSYTEQWVHKQLSPYVIKEAAIFFESGTDKGIDVMVGVYCPLELRVERVMRRNNISRDRVMQIVAKQMDEDEKMKRCDHVITNDDTIAVLPQVLALHDSLLKRASLIMNY